MYGVPPNDFQNQQPQATEALSHFLPIYPVHPTYLQRHSIPNESLAWPALPRMTQCPEQRQPSQFPQGNQHPQAPHSPKFSALDIDLLKLLLRPGEKHKWKQITKEINRRSLGRRGEMSDGKAGSRKNVSPTYVMKQYQNLLGLPNNSHFGVLGSSLPYVVSERGWQ